MNIRGDRVVAAMQFLLSVLFTLGYFAVLGIVLFGRADIPIEQLRLVDTLFGVLSAVLVQQSGYWFSRQRSQEASLDNERINRGSDSMGSPVINNYNAKFTQGRDLGPRR